MKERIQNHKEKQRRTTMSVNKAVGSAGLTALAAVAAYWMYGKRKKEKTSARGWMLKMKGDVVEKLEDIKECNRDAYNQAIDQVAHHYRKVKKVGEEELKGLVRDLRMDWREFSHKVMAGRN